MPLPPERGMYDPSLERDACGLGFVADLRRPPTHDIVVKGIEILRRLAHRGAAGCDPCTSDGAGILMHIPHAHFERVLGRAGVELPNSGDYAVAQCFLSRDAKARAGEVRVLEEAVRHHNQKVIGWRDVPVDPKVLGPIARSTMPVLRQLFIGRMCPVPAFERTLFMIRKRSSRRATEAGLGGFYVASLSSRTIVYKGLSLPERLDSFFLDLREEETKSKFALVHSRFSTNTFPTWERAHPYRRIAHNGEINTLRGNQTWMHAREALLESAAFGEHMADFKPIIRPGGSDSASLDNVVDFLVAGGRSLPHVMMMLVPEAWEGQPEMPPERRAFYEYHASLVEPWDGPAALAFTDGIYLGATLDRNGLRPMKYVITASGFVVAASEVGVVDFEPDDVIEKGRLQPGRMLLVDLVRGRVVGDEEIKREIASQKPYAEWLAGNKIDLKTLPDVAPAPAMGLTQRRRLQRAFGYSREDVRVLLAPMATQGEEPVGSMGTDAPLAVLSDRPVTLYRYFKQQFAQVTNPPIDPIREKLVMTLVSCLGGEGNLLAETPGQCRLLELEQPILTNEEMAKLLAEPLADFPLTVLPALFDATRRRSRRGARERAGRALRRRRASRRRAREPARGERPRCRRSARAHPEPSRDERAAPLARARRQAHAGRPHRRDRRRARGRGHRAARRPRRRRGEPVPRVRDRREPGDRRPRRGARAPLRARDRQGAAEGHEQDGHLVPVELPGRPDLRGDRHRSGDDRPLVPRDRLARRGHRAAGNRPRGDAAPRGGLPGSGQRRGRGRERRGRARRRGRVLLARRWRAAPVEPGDGGEPAQGRPPSGRALLRRLRARHQRARRVAVHVAWLLGLRLHAPGGPHRGGRAGGAHRPAVLDRRDELREHQQRGAREPRHRDEPHRRQVEHRRGRRGRGALSPDGERRQQAQRDQAGGERALRRDGALPRQLRRAADQDRPGRQAGRGRAAPGAQGRRGDRARAALGARRDAHLAAPASRHLLHRRPGAAHLRPEVRQLEGPRQRQARERDGGRHDRGGRRQGARRRDHDCRPRRRHRRVAALVHPARRDALGARARRDPPDPRPERPPHPRAAAGRRTAQDGARRGVRRAARRRRVRVRDGAARRERLHHDAQVSPQHVSGRHRDAGPGAAQALHGDARARRQLLLLRRRRAARDHGEARLPEARRDGRPRRVRREAPARAPQSAGSSISSASSCPRSPRSASKRTRRRAIRTSRRPWTCSRRPRPTRSCSRAPT